MLFIDLVSQNYVHRRFISMANMIRILSARIRGCQLGERNAVMVTGHR